MWCQRLLSRNVWTHGCCMVSAVRRVSYRPMAVTLWGMSFYSACEGEVTGTEIYLVAGRFQSPGYSQTQTVILSLDGALSAQTSCKRHKNRLKYQSTGWFRLCGNLQHWRLNPNLHARRQRTLTCLPSTRQVCESVGPREPLTGLKTSLIKAWTIKYFCIMMWLTSFLAYTIQVTL